MSRHLIGRSQSPSLESITNLAVLLSVACPFTEQDLHHILTNFSSPPDTKLEYSIAVREYLRAALLSCVNRGQIRDFEGVTADIKIEQWKEFLMYNVKRASSTELSLEDSWQAFVQSLNEHLGFETDKGFVHMQLRGRPFKVYARKKSPSALDLGVLSSHRIVTFKQLLEKRPSGHCLDSAKALCAAFWSEFCPEAQTPEAMRDGALRSIGKACGRGIDFHNDEWESSRPRASSLEWFDEERLAEMEFAEEMLAEACKLEAKTIRHAKERQSNIIMKLLQTGDIHGIQRIDEGSYEAPSRIYLRNLKCWEKRLTKLVNLERVQNEHCWQLALDFVRDHLALYSEWPVHIYDRVGILADKMTLWCMSTDLAKSQVQRFQKRVEAETEIHPRFQEVVNIILEWSQYCLDHDAKKKEEVNKKIDIVAESGASEALPKLCEFRDLVSCLETAWDQDKFSRALNYAFQFRDRSEDFKSALRYKGMTVDQSWREYDKEWAELYTKLGVCSRQNPPCSD
eukprot:Blabericola_migrator_1__6070@NODE_3062_length_2069_cov_76_395604_g1914_i0_p1_GENE_NODE_3062_length_2069_cov_76_395604_g1914_i0NODE_3062_length_2069_cov_76_395604_g1914_i0_p1_ORF_typecomplete_len512_score71_04_NODE_3062_length_2069_cov_76_395604_g1914_i01511686